MKRKGSALVGYWVQYVNLTFDLTHDLDLGFFKVKFWNSSISGIVGLIDVKWKGSELIWILRILSHPFMTMILTSVTMVGWADVPDSDRGDFRRQHAVDISSLTDWWGVQWNFCGNVQVVNCTVLYTFKTCPLAPVDEWENEYFCSWAPENDCTSGYRVLLQHLKSGRWYYCTNFHLLWSSKVKEFQQSLESLYYWHETYHKVSNIRCTKSPNLIVSCLVLQFSLSNPVKPGVRLRMKM